MTYPLTELIEENDMANKKLVISEYTGVTPQNIDRTLLYSEQPVILKNFASDWTLVHHGKKSLLKAMDYLRKKFDGDSVNACYLHNDHQGRVFYNKDLSGFNFDPVQLPLNDVLAQLIDQISKPHPDTIYVGSTSIKHYFPELLEEITIDTMPDDALTNIWMGNQTNISAHYDVAQNLACSVVGRRRFTLFPPEQIDNLYIGPIDLAPGGQPISLADLTNPDFERYPKLKHAFNASQVVELEVGDALIIPSMWWHQVEALAPFNVLINYWFTSGLGHLGQPSNALMHGILSLRDLPKVQKDAWKKLFDHYVFNDEYSNFEHIQPSAQGVLRSPLNEITARKLRAQIQNQLRR